MTHYFMYQQEYEDCEHFCILEGNHDPITFYPEFIKEYNIPEKPDTGTGYRYKNKETSAIWDEYENKMELIIDTLRLINPEMSYRVIPESFINWLVEKKGFKRINFTPSRIPYT